MRQTDASMFLFRVHNYLSIKHSSERDRGGGGLVAGMLRLLPALQHYRWRKSTERGMKAKIKATVGGYPQFSLPGQRQKMV